MINRYPDFNDVMNSKLQAYNRLNIVYNIKETFGNAVAVAYTKQFSKKAKAAILYMHQHINDVGFSTVRREMIASVA